MNLVRADAQDRTLDEARETVYRFLAAALIEPREDSWRFLSDRANQRAVRAAMRLLAHAFGESKLPSAAPMLRALPESLAELEREHRRVFGLTTNRDCPPYETEYLACDDAFFRAQQLADVAGFYRAFGLAPSSSINERPDHIALELEFTAFVLMKKRLAELETSAEWPVRAAVCGDAERAFFADHLAWWSPAFAAALRRRAEGGFYSAVGEFLVTLMTAERQRRGLADRPTPVGPILTAEPVGCAACAED